MEKGFGPLYTAFDENENREEYRSKDLSKGEIVKLNQDLYLAYLKVYYELKDTKAKLAEVQAAANEAIKEAEAPIYSLFESKSFVSSLEDFIDERIKSKLSLEEESVMYGGHYANLNYDNQELGSVTLG